MDEGFGRGQSQGQEQEREEDDGRFQPHFQQTIRSGAHGYIRIYGISVG